MNIELLKPCVPKDSNKFLSREEITEIDTSFPTVIATGPLTSPKLCETIKKLTNEQIECELNERNQLIISYTDSEGCLQCMEISEFPQLKEIEKTNYFLISTLALYHIM